jgi:hypothetical protein
MWQDTLFIEDFSGIESMKINLLKEEERKMKNRRPATMNMKNTGMSCKGHRINMKNRFVEKERNFSE